MSFVVNVQFVDHECDHEYEKDEVDDVVVDPLNHVVASSRPHMEKSVSISKTT